MLQTVFLFAVLIIAVIYDFWKCRIPNWLVVIGYFVGIASALWQDKLWYLRLTDSLLMLLILYPLFLFGTFGGGDVKLLLCIVAFVGFEEGACISIFAVIIGAVISMIKIVYFLCGKKMFQFSRLYIHFSLPIFMAASFSVFHGGFQLWNIF